MNKKNRQSPIYGVLIRPLGQSAAGMRGSDTVSPFPVPPTPVKMEPVCPFGWLGFTGTLSNVNAYIRIARLKPHPTQYRSFWKQINRWSLYISCSAVDDQRHKQPPRLALLFVRNGPKTCSKREAAEAEIQRKLI